MIVTQALTEATVDDAAAGIDLIRAAAGDVASVTGEGAYDTVAFYKAASARDGAITTWRRSGGAMDEGSGPSEVATALALTH